MSNKIISAKNFIIQKMEHFPNGVPPTPEDVENWIDEYARMYARECAAASLEKASESKESLHDFGLFDEYVKLESITQESNIILL